METETRTAQVGPLAGHGQKRSRRQERAIAALLECDSLGAAAEQAGIAKSTLSRWLTEPQFSEAYRNARGQLLSAAINRLRKLSRNAVDVLQEVAEDKKAPHAARVSAAARIIDSALEAAKIQDLVERVNDLEHRAKSREALYGRR
jgi:hypothetical protein